MVLDDPHRQNRPGETSAACSAHFRGMNNTRADCTSLHAPGGVNKWDCCVMLYFLFTHLCSARWRSDVVSLQPQSGGRVQMDETDWP